MSHNPNLSLFPSAFDPETVADLPLTAIITRIRSTELVEKTATIRERFALAGGGAAGKKAIEPLKKRLPGVTLAGAFDRRATAAWREPSGLVQIDLDRMTPAELAEARTRLIACPWVGCLWTSPSGAGIKGGVLAPGLLMPDPSRYTVIWRAVTRWLASIGLTNDPAAKDAARLAFLAHDPEAWHNPEAMPFPLDDWAEPEPVQAAPPRDVPERDAVRRAAAYLDHLPPSIAGQGGHPALFRAACALVHGFDLPEPVALDLLRAFNLRGDPETEAQLQHKITQAASHPHREPRGYLLIADRKQTENGPRVRASDPWPAPTPILAASDPPPFEPVGMLPADLPELVHLVESLAETVQVPRDLVAAAAVGLAALACSRSVEIRCAPDWLEPAPLWVLPLLRPGERKSASLSMLVRPFHAWAADERKAMAEPAARFAERRKTMEARLAAVRARAAKADGEDQRKLEREASDLAAELDGLPLRVAAPDLLVQSFTPEGLRDALETNGEKLGIVSAEADAAELLGARYSDAGPSLDLLLCAHAGDPITTRRAGGRIVPLDRPAVGMVLAVQPEAVRTVLADRAARGRGLIDRMLLVLPASRMGTRVNDPQPMTAEVSDWWASAVRALLDRPWPGRMILGYSGDPVRCTSPPRLLTLDPEARAILWTLRANIEPRLAEDADLAHLSGFASKLPGACARIALTFAMLRDPNAQTVGAEAMRAACAWASYLLAHHQAVLGDAAEPPEAHHARRLWRALSRRGKPTMTARELLDLVRDSAVPDMVSFRPILTLLADHGTVRPAPGEDPRPGRPAERWQIHPDLVPDSYA
ncbi:hypothetical protein LBMAG53_15440 [Planctomycetota bacterium]|nr:hypothetical protein LBMAG53_15440 [Planctomycetota bacterium]